MIIYGAGSFAERITEKLTVNNVECYIDSNPLKAGEYFLGKPVYGLEYLSNLEDKKDKKIYIASTFYYEILCELEKIGFIDGENIFNALSLISPKEVKEFFKIDMDVEDEFIDIYIKCKPYTMTNWPRMYSLYQSVKYIVNNKIPGSFVECGVWRGGSARVIMETLNKLNVSDRDLYLYDTYEGFDVLDIVDEDVDYKGKKAIEEAEEEDLVNSDVWKDGELNKVKHNLSKANYPVSKTHFIKGKVEDTIPATMPTSISILRLDTDLYVSTKHEMIHLYPILEKKGILIIDDYGHWGGAKKAVDEYLKQHGINPLLNKTDYTGRLFIKF